MLSKNCQHFLVACAFLTGSLAVTEIALTIAAFQLLNRLKTRVATQLPHGILHADPILDTGIAIIVVSILAILPSIFGSVFRLAHRCPTENFRYFAIVTFAYLPVLVVGTVIGLTWHASVTSALPQLMVKRLIAGSGMSLYYHSYRAVMAVIVNGWIVFASLVLATMLERMTFKATQQDQQTMSSPVFLTDESKNSDEEGI
ncbi:uncharacterized protein MELLADRAFT_118125 [Melampsora larici-populina 98AG31]|uniref:Uncharacterized protein n=1 Tax=Melampsora larici-populina (strain 98AG31 / pathotype 3-4-7) TaxID=747676 RepID=F4S5B1_MELLP|nr:uncharacterized protein MELLADRAFT_118125 [Melampsora larici-populina 98AG31]EGG00191.1 hypothetical protein MELLADRAFT_118125 [Melampsora larici-populina 98AG31]